MSGLYFRHNIDFTYKEVSYMANYDRRLLVPYLQDVCSSELLCSHIEKEIDQCNYNISSLNNALNQRFEEPCRPQKSSFGDLDAVGDWFWLIVSIGAVLLGLAFNRGILAKIFIIGGSICVIILASCIYSGHVDKENRYANALDQYYRTLDAIKQEKDKFPQYRNSLYQRQQELSLLMQRHAKAKNLRSKIYSVNIIPSKYRDKYAAYYLYDYFSTSRENDLDKIIQTLLLDEIKQKLDKIIAQNEEIALVQRYQVALQESQNKAIAENHREQLQQIAQLESNQELQLDYQRMIAANQEVTNFFLAADYIEKYRNR